MSNKTHHRKPKPSDVEEHQFYIFLATKCDMLEELEDKEYYCLKDSPKSYKLGDIKDAIKKCFCCGFKAEFIKRKEVSTTLSNVELVAHIPQCKDGGYFLGNATKKIMYCKMSGTKKTLSDCTKCKHHTLSNYNFPKEELNQFLKVQFK